MKRCFLLLLFLPSILIAQNSIVWDFKNNSEGWHDLGAGRDVSVSWSDGSLKMTYFENSPGQGPQLWFAAVQVEYEFDAGKYRYLEMSYRPFNWPAKTPVKFLVQFMNSKNEPVYAYADLDPLKNFVSIDIATLDPGWGKPYSGLMKTVYLEIPHNGAAAANPATNWFGAWTLIDKVELTDTPTIPPSTDKVLHWTFDKDFSDSTHTVTGIASGNPVIDAGAAKVGSGALVLGGSDYLTLPADSVFSSENSTYTFWIKTPAAGQANPAIPSRIISFGNGNFELALYQGNLSLGAYRSWINLVTPWKNNVWLRVALVVDGSNVSCFINGIKISEAIMQSGKDRSGNLAIGINGLKAIVDELSIYNYVLSDGEIAEDGLIPPGTVAPWTFDADLEGWHEIQDGINRDVTLSWQDGAMVMTYTDKATREGPQLWFPKVEVNTIFDTELYPFCDIYYETAGWPVSSLVKAMLEFTMADGTVAYSYFDLNPSETLVRVDIPNSDPGWGVNYSGITASVRLEIPHNASAVPAEDWFGASTKITKVEFNNTQPPVADSWNSTLRAATFNKSGMSRFNNPKFQYQTIGLGGTTMRVDPWGFASRRAPNTNQNSYNHKPSFGYEYWWDKTGHRYNPFLISAGYGASFDTGTISAFQQSLDINTGVLETKLNLTVGGTTFTSTRETFITPDGILVIRVQDNGAPSPLQLNLAINETVEWFGTYYAGQEDPFIKDTVHTSNRSTGATGGVVAVHRPNTSDCAVAVAVEASSAETVSANSDVYSQTSADGTITFYIAPKSSFNPATTTVPWDHAWNAASAAKTKGYAALKQLTADWWIDFLNVSKISVPDEKVSKLYAQSLYYHGIYFGNSTIPPGCFGTDIYGFFGAVCPEYDLNFSSFALAYTGHISETKNIADWVYSVLPKCKEQATQGVWHHDVFRKYNSGAIYTTLMGYDGTITIQGEPFEGGNLRQNYPGLNSARMALNYLDFSDDQTFRDAAQDVLKSTTYIALEDLVSNGRGSYADGKIPNCMQEGAVLMGYEQCVKRGIADTGWITKYQDKILMPQGVLKGDTLLSAGVGHNPSYGDGSSTWFYPLWWATVIDKHDPRAVKAIDNYHATFQSYCFNNGWSGVHSAKVYRGDDALMWLENFQRPDVLLDETSFAENSGEPGYNYTPEIGAHGAYICNLTQMLIDPDEDSIVDIFPAIPNPWEYKKVAFEGLLTTGALSFTAERDIKGVKAEVTNHANSVKERLVRIKIPRFLDVQGADSLIIEDGFIVNRVSLMPGETKSYAYTFSLLGIHSSIHSESSGFEPDGFSIYPNPNSTGILNIRNSQKIDMVLIYSLTGRLVKKFQNQKSNYFVGELETGIYIIQIKADHNFYAKRLCIVR